VSSGLVGDDVSRLPDVFQKPLRKVVSRTDSTAENRVSCFAPWFRNRLSEYVKEILLESQTLRRPYFARGKVETIQNELLDGQCDRILSIARMLALGLTSRLLIDAGSDPRMNVG
jgi:hypothetical protein